MCLEGEARQVLGAGDRAERIVEIVDRGWLAHVEEKRARSKRTRANIVWDYMVAAADLHLTGQPGISRIELHGTPMWVFDDFIVLRFKKHDRERFTRNYPTPTQQEITATATLPGLPELHHLACGYQLDLAEASVQQIIVTKRIGQHVEWFIDMRGLASGMLDPVTRPLPFSPSSGDAIRPLPRVVPPATEKPGDTE